MNWITSLLYDFSARCYMSMSAKIEKLKKKNKIDKSDSENTKYVKALERINSSDSNFNNFRRVLAYRLILEHLNFRDGSKYLSLLSKRKFPVSIISDISRKNDAVGNPKQYTFPLIGKASPTTMRYIKVLSDLQELFGERFENIVEIGVGYGGQAAVISQNLEVNRYVLMDLPPAIKLTLRYLTELKLVTKMEHIKIEDFSEFKVDLVISNYAFSELPRKLQSEYCEKVLSKATSGYLTMNSGRTNFTKRSIGKLSLEEILAYIPNGRILHEIPLTGKDNYILVWGNKKSGEFKELKD